MGMFDRLYDANGDEWQTKALGRGLTRYEIGDSIPLTGATSYQVEILGGDWNEFIDSFATVKDGLLASVHDRRDERLPLFDYCGHLLTIEGSRFTDDQGDQK